MQLQLGQRYGGIKAWGGEMMDPHYSAAWAWGGNTPLQGGKQVGSDLGGTRNPLVVHWPERIRTERGYMAVCRTPGWPPAAKPRRGARSKPRALAK